MVIQTDGNNRIRDLVGADISSVVLGTDGTSATKADGSLGTAVVATSKAPDITYSNQKINVRHTLLSSEGNGNTFKEIGVYMNSDAVLLDRVVIPDYEKTSANELVTLDIFKIGN